jgi:hypothetical protein
MKHQCIFDKSVAKTAKMYCDYLITYSFGVLPIFVMRFLSLPNESINLPLTLKNSMKVTRCLKHWDIFFVYCSSLSSRLERCLEQRIFLNSFCWFLFSSYLKVFWVFHYFSENNRNFIKNNFLCIMGSPTYLYSSSKHILTSRTNLLHSPGRLWSRLQL